MVDPKPAQHIPVLLTETLGFLAPERGGTFVDCTLGLGGHSAELLRANPELHLVGIDQDPEALEIAAQRLDFASDRVTLVRGNFAELEDLLPSVGLERVDGIFADLGVSSIQLDRGYRGFSFRKDGPLDMRMDPEGEVTAAQIVNGYSEEELQRIFSQYGEERQSRRIARRLVEKRRTVPFETTSQLSEEIAHAKWRPKRDGRPQRIDPATRVFQALRIEVNQELAGLRRFLDQSLKMLETEGRLVVISYHSLEDRLVKGALRSAANGEVDPITGRRRTETRLIEVLTKKPVRPTEAESEVNPRSRSGRLRAARRL